MKHWFEVLILASILSGAPAAASDFHASFDTLLARYVTESGVQYEGWAASPRDMQSLRTYIDRLESANPEGLEEAAALAYWINLYNATTLELVLANYPVDSIKDTAGFLKSPWNKKLVTVLGEELSLNQIENEIIRKRFEDVRIHFALNCASVGCPPLATKAYRGETLDEQLEDACRRALNDPLWVKVENDRLVLTKIFDWYREDFEKDAGSVIGFIARYRGDGGQLEEKERKIEYADYDWSLNEAP